MRGVLTTIRSAGGFASAIALSALVWACGAPSPGGVCSTIGDCPRGQACVDGRCELRPGGDGGGRMDAGAGQIDGAPSDAAPREDVACVAVESR